MTEPFDRKLFEQIFSDAHLIDVDFSNWDKSLSICVIADHVDVSTPEFLPLFIVEFAMVSKFNLHFNHFEIELDEPEQHFQWNIGEYQIGLYEHEISVLLFGSHICPKLEIVCKGIMMRRIDHSALDRLFHGWNRPYAGLARPGIEALAKIL
jgi:hypothetical protein